MAENDSGEKTEEPTSKRLEESREKGQIAKTPELGTAGFLIGSTLAMAFAGPPLWRFLLDSMGSALSSAGDGSHYSNSVYPWLQTMGYRTLLALMGFVVAMAAIAVALQLVQTGGLLSAKTLTPNFGRLNPTSNIGRLFSTQSLIELAKSLIKLGIVSWAVYGTLSDAWPSIQALAAQSPTALTDLVDHYGIGLLKNAGMMFLFLAGADYAWQRFKTMEDLKMTKQEVKEEMKSQEGNMEMKSRRRAIGRERIRRAMFKAVPKADVVIVNPIHIAVAIQYDPTVAPAPMVVAIGQRKVAEKIKELAYQHGVPVVENIPLARALFATAKLGSVIPMEMYLAVAEVLAFVMRQRERFGTRWQGTAVA